MQGLTRRQVSAGLGATLCTIAFATCAPVILAYIVDPDATLFAVLRAVVAGAALALAAVLLTLTALDRRQSRVDPRVLEQVARLERQTTSRIAGQLHDTAVQSLVVASFLAQSGHVGDPDSDALADQLVNAEREVRDVILNAREPDITALGLGAGCQYLHQMMDLREGLRVTWDWDAHHAVTIPVMTATLAYRFLLETLNNVAKHSGASVAHVTLMASGDQLVVSVQDSGCGFARPYSLHATPNQANPPGLTLLASRVALLDARMSVTTGPTQGSTVTLRVPLDDLDDQTMVRIGTPPHDPATGVPTGPAHRENPLPRRVRPRPHGLSSALQRW